MKNTGVTCTHWGYPKTTSQGEGREGEARDAVKSGRTKTYRLYDGSELIAGPVTFTCLSPSSTPSLTPSLTPTPTQ